MWIVLWDQFLMKKLLKSEVCESCEQCMGPTIFQQNAGTHKKCAFQTNGCVWIPLILLKIENWKHYSKIICKCVNNVVEPIFNESFVEKRGLWVLWTVHETHWKAKKKKKKDALNTDARRLINIQKDTKSLLFLYN